uniref:Uncharacterized protein n=1 Tax=Timema bartmani TaxID=61472 RepID=A0A7R9I1U6_9NEOP|nr:unnamed protein product [Timema bartmani]
MKLCVGPNRLTCASKHNNMNMCPNKREAVEASSSNLLHPETECLSCDFVSAVISRYIRRSQDQLRTGRDECLDDVEMDNTEPSSQSCEQMNILILSGLHISRPGPEGGLKGLFSNVTELYLRHNLFISWEDVATITSQFPRLDLLDMTGNRLKPPNDPFSLQRAFQFITRLVLGDMCYTWLDVLVCSILRPQLTELYCTNNSITTINSPSPDIFSHLQVLDLSRNNITCWEQVNNLGRLSSLRYLNLQDCSLQDITFPDCCIGEKSELFPTLSRLNLSDNSIRSWQHVAELDKQPALRELRLMRNPLDEGQKQDYIREMIIVNVGGIIKLNGSHLGPNERKNCEMSYLWKYYPEWLCAERESKGSQQLLKQFMKSHPRFEPTGIELRSPCHRQPDCESDTLDHAAFEAGNNFKILEIHVVGSLPHFRLTSRSH